MGKMKKKLNEWDFNILTSIEGFEKLLGVKSTKNRKLYNGTIRCYYYQYFDNVKIKNPGDTLINDSKLIFGYRFLFIKLLDF
ncbi:Uncharacterised protein [Clostridioides difficile]|nr:Uncharacterised protein [Clostridioides difficile]